MNNCIIIKGAREHNLKNIDLKIPRDSFVVVTGLSGSGKSSLVFDTIYAEGQRRYIESLSTYARQFLDNFTKPDVDLIDGLSPSIAIEQKSTVWHPRSTVGTTTEIYDYIRLLFAKVGEPFCPTCKISMQKNSPNQILQDVLNRYNQKKILILSPVVIGRKGSYKELLEEFIAKGFLKARIDGEIVELYKGMSLERYKVHDIYILIDKLIANHNNQKRVKESIDLALKFSKGNVVINCDNKDKFYSLSYICSKCGYSLAELSPNNFSFNSIYGACPYCEGLGIILDANIDFVFPNKKKSLEQGAIEHLIKKDSYKWFSFLQIIKKAGIATNQPIKSLTKDDLNFLLYGIERENKKTEESRESNLVYNVKFKGLVEYLYNNYLEKKDEETESEKNKIFYYRNCPVCDGSRLKKEYLNVYFKEKNIFDIVSMPLDECYNFFDSIILSERETIIAVEIIKEIKNRIKFLLDVGLEYLTLNRSANSLSGGEAQRIRLASQIGSQLSGAIYALDEPSIGLHQRDNIKLIESLKSLRDLGNTIIVVEHDRETIENSDYLVDLGPGAGTHGGNLVVLGETKNLLKQKDLNKSLTLEYIARKRNIELPESRRKGSGKYLQLIGATGNNLKNVNLKLPLGMFIAITGVSGSGKSSLINDTLAKILKNHFYKSFEKPLPYKEIKGLEHLDKVIEVDQTPIGRTPRSNPATYIGFFTQIRELYSMLPESKARGYKPGRFSFNVKGGRCESCGGAGVKRIEMNFLPDVYIICDECQGKRFNRETLEILYKGKSIYDVLEMTAEEAYEFFQDHPVIARKIKAMNEVGLSYIKLGQQATTLSGGEAQRVKLATELSKVQTGKTIYILDEPSTGLHFEDVKSLLKALNLLVDKGNTVVIIEHNLDIIKVADWIIDLGPEGGEKGGQIIAEGTPEEIINNPNSITGKYLRKELSCYKKQN